MENVKKLSATDILDYLQERRLVQDCVSWCAWHPEYAQISRNTLFRAAQRDQKKEPYTSRQRFFLRKIQEFVDMKKEEFTAMAAPSGAVQHS